MFMLFKAFVGGLMGLVAMVAIMAAVWAIMWAATTWISGLRHAILRKKARLDSTLRWDLGRAHARYQVEVGMGRISYATEEFYRKEHYL